jgi:hypothetical protein
MARPDGGNFLTHVSLIPPIRFNGDSTLAHRMPSRRLGLLFEHSLYTAILARLCVGPVGPEGGSDVAATSTETRVDTYFSMASKCGF